MPRRPWRSDRIGQSVIFELRSRTCLIPPGWPATLRHLFLATISILFLIRKKRNSKETNGANLLAR